MYEMGTRPFSNVKGETARGAHEKYTQAVPTPSSGFDGLLCRESPSSRAAAGPSAATITPRAAFILLPPSNETSAGPLSPAALTDAAGVPVCHALTCYRTTSAFTWQRHRPPRVGAHDAD